VLFRSFGLVIINVSDPLTPFDVGWLDTSGSAHDVYVEGDLAFVADSQGGLLVIDVSSPETPMWLSTYGTRDAVAVFGVGPLVYVADQDDGMRILDVSTPAAPTLVGAFNASGGEYGVMVDDNIAYLAAGAAGLRLIDVSAPSSPFEVAFYDTTYAVGVAKHGLFVYLADTNGGAHMFDVSDPAAPARVSTYPAGWAADVNAWVDPNTSNEYVGVAGAYEGLLILERAALAVDLYVTDSDITFDPPSPVEAGVDVSIQATVHNDDADPGTCTASFYLGGPPESGGTLLGAHEGMIVPAEQSRTVSVNWQTTARYGVHDIWVVLENVRPSSDDPANNTAFRSFEVGDTIAPQTVITSGPANGSYLPTLDISFEWVGSDAGTPIENLEYSYCLAPAAVGCDPASGPFGADTSVSFVDLLETDSPHVFAVTARDSAGNADETPATRTFRVDVTEPQVDHHTPNGTVNSCVDSIDVVFNETMDADSVEVQDVTMSGPAGDVAVVSVTFVDQPAQQTLRIRFALSQCANGTYELVVGPDISDLAGNPMNGSYVGTIAVALPDLNLSDLDAPPEAWTGQPLTIGWTVANVGAISTAAAWNDCVYLSTDAVPGGDILVTCLARPENLGPGASYQRAATATTPELQEGDYWLVVIADDGATILESEESNNVRVLGPVSIYVSPCPDLYPHDLSIPTEPATAGGEAFVDWLVTNNGNGATNEPFWFDRLYLSTNAALDGGDVAVSPAFENPMFLNAQESYPQAVAFAVPSYLFGEYYIIVKTDADGDIGECDETNNVLVSTTTLTIEQRLPAILSATNCQIDPPDPWPGEAVSLTWTITNTGETPTGLIAFDHAIVFSDDDVLAYPGDRILKWHVGQLITNLGVAESSETVSATVYVPNDQWGDFYLIVWPDPPQMVDVGRDPCAVPLTVQSGLPADLELAASSVPTQAASGSEIDVMWTVRNAAVSSTSATWWKDKLFLSVDDSLDTSEDNILLGDYNHYGALDFDERYTGPESGAVRLPNDAVGVYYLLIAIDADDRVFEGGWEQNNVGVIGTVDVAFLPPDMQVTDLELLSEGIPVSIAKSGTQIAVVWEATNTGEGVAAMSPWRDRVYLSSDAVLDIPGDTVLSTVTHYGPVAPGVFYSVASNVTIPMEQSGAAMRIYVCADFSNNQYELDDSNNCIAGEPFEVVWSPPDLVVQRVLVDDEMPIVSGQVVIVEWTVANVHTGATASNSWDDDIYLSVDDLLDPGDRFVARVAHFGALLPEESYTATRSVLVPIDFVASNVHVLVKTDSQNRVHELDNDDNVNGSAAFSIEWGMPDLHVESVWTVGEVTAGGPLTLHWRVRNAGGPTLAGSWLDAAFLSADNVLDAYDTALAPEIVHSGDINYNGAYSETALITIPPEVGAMFYLAVATDVGDAVGESNELANSLIVPVRLTPQPVDLQVTALQTPAMALSGQPIQVSWTVTNLGNGVTPAGGWRDAAYLSPDPYLDSSSDRYLGFVEHRGALSPYGQSGDRYEQFHAFTVPFGLAGPHYWFIVTDVSNNVGESNAFGDAEYNNDIRADTAVRIEIPPPADLVVTDVSAPANGMLGEPITLQWTVRNDGDFQAQGRWHDSAYLSRDDQWDIQDAHLGTVEHYGPLAPNATYVEFLTATLSGVVPDGYHIVIRTDIHDEVRETLAGENNNTAASPNETLIESWTLLLGTPDDSRELQTGSEHYFQIPYVADGETLVVTLDTDDDTTYTELYLGRDRVPTPGAYDFAFDLPFNADHEIVVAQAQEGSYYVSVRGLRVPAGASSYTITAGIAAFEAKNVTPTQCGNVGEATLTIRGAHFDSWTRTRLLGPGGDLEPHWQYVADPTRLAATFDLAGARSGFYDVVVGSRHNILDLDPDTRELYETEEIVGAYTMYNALEVLDGGGPQIHTDLQVPSLARQGLTYPCIITVTNIGNTDATIPAILVASPNGTPLGPTAGLTEASASQMQVLPMGPGLRMDRLAPQEQLTITLHALAAWPPAGEIWVQDLTSPGTPLDWSALEPYYADLQDEDWQITWSNFELLVGNSWNALHDAMRRVALADAAGSPSPPEYYTGHELIVLLLERARLALPIPAADTVTLAGGEHRATQLPDVFPNPAGGNGCDDCEMSGPELAFVKAELVAAAGTLGRLMTLCGAQHFLHFVGGGGERNYTLDYDGWGLANSVNTNERFKSWQHSVKSAVRQAIKGMQLGASLSCGDQRTFSLNDLIPDDGPENALLHPLFDFSKEGGALGTVLGHVPGDNCVPANVTGTVAVRKSCDCNDCCEGLSVKYDLKFFMQDLYDFCPGGGLSNKWSAWFGNQLIWNIRQIETCEQQLNGKRIEYYININIDHSDAASLGCGETGGNSTDPPCCTPKQPPANGCALAADPCPDCGSNQPPVAPTCGPNNSGLTPIVGAVDPNEKIAPSGFGERGFIRAGQDVTYTIRFENLSDATAAAQTVTVTDRLDPGFDWRTFRLGRMGFGEWVVEVPPNRARFQTRVDLTDPFRVFVDIECGIDIETGIAQWIFQAIDPDTGEPPNDALLGFLPPNDPLLHDGEGYVTFTIRSKTGGPTGSAIENQATIIFDVNAPIDTGTVSNTLDGDAPESAVNGLPAEIEGREIVLNWSGDDPFDGSGLATFTIYLSTDGGAFVPFIQNTRSTSGVYWGEPGHTYTFYSQAMDNVGNIEPAPAKPDATITIAGCTDTDPPFIVHGDGRLGETQPCSGYIDPRLENLVVNEVDTAQGIRAVTLKFSEPVYSTGGGELGPQDFVVTQSGNGPPPTALDVVRMDTARKLYRVVLDGIVPVQEWTTIRAVVQDACGNAILSLGDLGPGQLEPDCIDLGRLAIAHK